MGCEKGESIVSGGNKKKTNKKAIWRTMCNIIICVCVEVCTVPQCFSWLLFCVCMCECVCMFVSLPVKERGREHLHCTLNQ